MQWNCSLCRYESSWGKINIVDNTDVHILQTVKPENTFCFKRGFYQDRDIIIKEVCSTSKLKKNAQFILANELMILSRIGKHSNIISPVGLLEINSYLASLYELDYYKELKDYLDDHNYLIVSRIAWILKRLVSALQHLYLK